MSSKNNHERPLFIRPLERRIMLDAAFGETFDPETTTTFEGGSFQDAGIDNTGGDVAAGDFNGDGYDDLLVLSSESDGESTLIYGSADRTDMGDMTEADLDATNSVVLTGDAWVEQESITFIGDINNDGYEDIAIANPGDGLGEGVRIVLGSASPAATIDLTNTTQSNVFVITGAADDTTFGQSVSGAGDVNNDGYDDIIIGSPQSGTSNAGRGYVIFGHGGSFSDIDLSNDPLDGTDGFAIQGHVVGATGDQLGADVSAAGDFNGDGIDDVAISTTVRDGGKGAAFVVYGSDSGFAASMNINDLDATTGMSIYGGTADGITLDDFGSTLESAGDFNGDGFDDLAISNYSAGAQKYGDNDGVHIIYGSNSQPAELTTNDIDGTNGMFVRTGNGAGEFGADISGGVDLDGDGFGDLLISAHGEDANGVNSGAAYVIYGNNRGNAVLLTSTMDSADGTLIKYDAATNTDFNLLGDSVEIGNFDGDTYHDIVMGDSSWNTAGEGKVHFFYGIQGNTPPTITAIADQTILEETSTGTLAFTIDDIDGEALTVTATSSNTTLIPNNNITISGTGDNRTIELIPGTDRTGTATINVTVEDTRGSDTTTSFDVTVTNVNDAPVVSGVSDQTVNQNSSSWLDFTVTDVDGDVPTVTATSSNTTLIPNSNLDVYNFGTARRVAFEPATNQVGTATITLTVDDGNGGVVTQTFDVTVNGVPTSSSIADQTINEDTGTGPIAFTVNDAENDPVYVSASSSDTTLIPNGNIVLGGSGENRTVSVTPAADQVGTATITLTLNDGNGGITTETFDVTVNNVNDAPTVSAIADQTINEDNNTGPIAFTVGDVEGDTISIGASSSNTALIPDGNIVLSGSGANRTVAVTPLADQYGVSTITLTLDDGNGGITTETFDVTVTNVNDAPAMSSIVDQEIDQDTSTEALTISVNDIEGDALGVSGSSSNTTLVPDANIVVSGTGANRAVTVTPASGQSGTATITLTLDDGNGGTATETFDVVVNAVDESVNDDLFVLEEQSRQLKQVLNIEPSASLSENSGDIVQKQVQSGQPQDAFSLVVSNLDAKNFTQTFYGSQFNSVNEFQNIERNASSQSFSSGTDDNITSESGMNDKMIDITTSIERQIYGQDGSDVDAYLRYWDKLYDADNAQQPAGQKAPIYIEPSAGEPASNEANPEASSDIDKKTRLDDYKSKETLSTKLAFQAQEFDQFVERLMKAL